MVDIKKIEVLFKKEVLQVVVVPPVEPKDNKMGKGAVSALETKIPASMESWLMNLKAKMSSEHMKGRTDVLRLLGRLDSFLRVRTTVEPPSAPPVAYYPDLCFKFLKRHYFSALRYQFKLTLASPPASPEGIASDLRCSDDKSLKMY